MSPAVLRTFHRWLALALFLPALLVCLSGATLVFREALVPWATPSVIVSGTKGVPTRYESVLAAARASAPGAEVYDLLAARPGRAVEVWVQQGGVSRTLFVDAATGAIVADSERQFLPFAFLYRLHKSLLWQGGGETLTGLAGCGLLLLSATGLLLWWRYRAMRWRVRWSGGALALSFDLHRLTGVVCVAILLANALTGAAMAFDGLASRAVNALASAEAATSPADGTPGPMHDLDELLGTARQALPGGELARVTVREGKGWVIARLRLPGEQATFGMNRVHVEASTGNVLRVSRLAELPPGSAMFEWLYPLHTGRLIGDAYRALLLIVGAAPAVLLATGFVLWRRRRRPSA